MELRGFLISVLLFSMVVIGFSGFMGDAADSYGTELEDLSGLGPISEIQNASANVEDAFRNTEFTGIDILDVPLAVANGMYQIVKLILGSMADIWSIFINTIAGYLHLPGWFVSLAVSIVVISLIFEVLSVTQKYKM